MTDWRSLDLGTAIARLTINGREIGRGAGADVMGHPLNALAWLANKKAEHGAPLLRGMVVMTGSIIATKFPEPGDRCLVEIDGLGSAGLTLRR